jgi:hypothetical protein
MSGRIRTLSVRNAAIVAPAVDSAPRPGGRLVGTTDHRGRSSLRGAALRRFVRHYLEMVVAMLVGMAVLGPVESWVLDPIGWADLRAVPEADALVMATNMTVAMVAWMRFRGHGWSPTTEMAAVMYLSFLVLLPLLWVGLLSDGGFMALGHVLMFTAMAAVMLRRPDEYTGHHHRTRAHGSAYPPSTSTAGRPANR